jgi:DNA polymerase-1
MSKELLVLFDGNSLVHRAFHAFQRNREPLTVRRTGEITGAVYGFTSMLLKVINDRKPDYCAVAFDMRAPTFRHEMFEQYKANRPETPDELVRQLVRTREVVRAFGIPIYEQAGFEADDLLGTLARLGKEKELDVIVVTGDADAMQLVEDSVSVLYPKPGQTFSDTQLFDGAAVKEKYGVTPAQFADFKGLKGDASDNIPGVPGVGDKTAVKLLDEFASIDGIYANIDKVTPPRIKESLAQNKAGAYESRELATIRRDAPIEFKPERVMLTTEGREQVISLFRELEFVSLIDRLPEPKDNGIKTAAPTETVPDEMTCRLVNAEESLKELSDRLTTAGDFAFDTETTSLSAMNGELVGISFAVQGGESFYIPVGHTGLLETNQLPLDIVVEAIKPLMENSKILKRAHNGKYDMIVFAKYGIKVKNLAFDTMIAGYLLGEKALGLKDLAFNRLGLVMTPISDLIGSGKKTIPMSQVPVDLVRNYCGADAAATWQLSELLKPELEKQGLWSLFADIEMPLVPVLVEMEMNGVLVDKEQLKKLSERLDKEITALEEEIYKLVGHDFNINSTQQLGIILFDEKKLPAGRKTKTGYSTEAAVLEDLRHSLIESAETGDRENLRLLNMLVDYRTLSKLKSTYIDALPELINPRTGRIHTSFNQTVATTGRLSSSDPNLQNIPVRGERGKEIRESFIAPPGKWLIAGDYSQIDLRVLAHLSQDPALLATFRAGKDVHSATASQLFGVLPDKVTPDMRRLAKTVNFGVIYGMSDYGLEQATELSRAQAHQFITDYFARFPGVKQYLEETKEMARKKGYVQTLLGRRRYIPEINSPNRQVRESAERMAINMPVQGTSADIIKIAMVRLGREMNAKQVKSQLLLQVHDELIFEVPEDELEAMRRTVTDVMSTAIILSVPVKVDMKKGRNWGEMD